ncbi:hypothetical protein ACHQM5_016732 [Ranunculus cassubicifolius]
MKISFSLLYVNRTTGRARRMLLFDFCLDGRLIAGLRLVMLLLPLFLGEFLQLTAVLWDCSLCVFRYWRTYPKPRRNPSCYLLPTNRNNFQQH